MRLCHLYNPTLTQEPLSLDHREHRILRTSFRIKLAFIILELILIIAFGVCSRVKRRNAAAILEWIIAFIFSAYVFSFIVDLWPAMHTKPARRSRLHRHSLGMGGAHGVCDSSSGSAVHRDWSPREMEEANPNDLPMQPRQAHMDRVPNNF